MSADPWQMPEVGDRVEADDADGQTYRGEVVSILAWAGFLFLPDGAQEFETFSVPLGYPYKKLPKKPVKAVDLKAVLANSFCDICGCTYFPGTHRRDPATCQRPRRQS